MSSPLRVAAKSTIQLERSDGTRLMAEVLHSWASDPCVGVFARFLADPGAEPLRMVTGVMVGRPLEVRRAYDVFFGAITIPYDVVDGASIGA